MLEVLFYPVTNNLKVRSSKNFNAQTSNMSFANS